MTLNQTLTALVQQMAADGLRITQREPLAVDGPAPVVLRYRAVMGYLRDKAARLVPPIELDAHLATLPDSGANLDQHEAALLRQLGRMVWINDATFIYGRLEAVLPGVALVTPRPNPNLPADPVAAFRARTEHALPFALHLIEAGDQPVYSYRPLKETA